MCVTLHPLSSFSIRMQKAFLLLFLFLFPSSNVSTRTATPEKKVATSVPAPQKMDGEQLFEDMQLGGVVNFLAFRQAVAGYNLIKQKSKSILTLIDFTKSSTEKRLFVFDMEQKKMLYSSVVSHGKNSGYPHADLQSCATRHIRVSCNGADAGRYLCSEIHFVTETIPTRTVSP